MTIFTLGKKVPNFTLPEITGQEFSLETYLKESKGWKLIIFLEELGAQFASMI